MVISDDLIPTPLYLLHFHPNWQTYLTPILDDHIATLSHTTHTCQFILLCHGPGTPTPRLHPSWSTTHTQTMRIPILWHSTADMAIQQLCLPNSPLLFPPIDWTYLPLHIFPEVALPTPHPTATTTAQPDPYSASSHQITFSGRNSLPSQPCPPFSMPLLSYRLTQQHMPQPRTSLQQRQQQPHQHHPFLVRRYFWQPHLPCSGCHLTHPRHSCLPFVLHLHRLSSKLPSHQIVIGTLKHDATYFTAHLPQPPLI